jgi:hypothetical protein
MLNGMVRSRVKNRERTSSKTAAPFAAIAVHIHRHSHLSHRPAVKSSGLLNGHDTRILARGISLVASP